MTLDPYDQLHLDFLSNHVESKDHMVGYFVFFVELGSTVTVDLDYAIDTTRRVLADISRIAHNSWYWCLVDRGVYLEADQKKSYAIDWKRELWINFANGDDAMLSRISIMDLKGARHADGRNVFTTT